MFRGLANLNLVATDMDAAIDWYTAVFDSPPYFVRPESGPPNTQNGALVTMTTSLRSWTQALGPHWMLPAARW